MLWPPLSTPVRSAVKSNLTDWCSQNLSKRALNALTVQASTTELRKLFQIRFFSVPSQEIGWEERLRNEFFCRVGR